LIFAHIAYIDDIYFLNYIERFVEHGNFIDIEGDDSTIKVFVMVF